MSGIVTIGEHLKAARLGFRLIERLGCYVRVRTPYIEDGLICELYPAGVLGPSNIRANRFEYRRWWEDKETANALGEALHAALVWAPPGPTQLVLNDDGTRAA